MFKKRGAINCTVYYSCWIENTKGHIGHCQPSFSRAVGIVAGPIVAIGLIGCPTTSCWSDGKVWGKAPKW